MNLPKNFYFCPQCGIPAKHLSRGWAQARRCESCGAQFSVSQAPTDTSDDWDLRLQHTSHWRWWVVGAVILALAVSFLLPMWSSFSRSDRSSVEARVNLNASRGRAQATTLYEESGKISRIDLFKQRNEQNQDEYTVAVTDMQSGAALSEPQLYRLPWMLNGEEFRSLSDGKIYLQLKEKIMLQLDAETKQFVDITPQLSAKFPSELGVGIAQVKFAYKDRPDGFEVLANDGKKYWVYWLIGQIRSQDKSSEEEQKIAAYTDLKEDYEFAPINGGSSLNRAYLLIKTWRKTQSGQPQYRGYVELVAMDGETYRRDPRNLREMDGGYAVQPYVLNRGLTKLLVQQPATPRFNAAILASNAQSLLLSYTPTPDEMQGRELQLLNRQSGQIVWSRLVEQLPQITRGGAYLSADALPSGFFLHSDGMTPSLLIGNDGRVLHDFNPPKD